MGVSQFHPLLIPLYFDTFEKKDKILDSDIKYGAAVLFAQRQTNVIENEIEIFLNNYITNRDLENKFENLINEINHKKSGYIQDFRSTLYMSNYRNRKQKDLTLLKFIEAYGNKNNDILHALKTGINSLTLEHIMPETPSTNLNYIGNLTLLKKSDNSGVQNIPFIDKKETYRTSLYKMTSNIIEQLPNNIRTGQDFDQTNYINSWNPQYTELVDEEALNINDHWTKEAVIARGKKMTKFVIELLE